MVAMIAVDIATIMLLSNAPWTTVSPSTLSYHLRLKPCQSVTRRSVALKLKTTTTTIGTYRNR